MKKLIFLVLAAPFFVSAEQTKFSYESLVELIEKENLSSIEEVLPKLPQAMLDKPLLARKSRSLQESSPMFPRAILFNRDASFVLTFNGHEEHRQHHALEILQFRPDEKKFELREVEFINGEAHFSEKNPSKCLGCHRLAESPRPIWDQYNFWPGMYGSEDDSVLTEAEDLRKFSEKSKSHERYKYLQISDELRDFEVRNAEFTGRLSTLNFQRIAKLAQQIPNYDKFKYAMLSGFCYDNSLKGFLPEELYDIHLRSRKIYEAAASQYGEEYFRNARSSISNIAAIALANGGHVAHWSPQFMAPLVLSTPGHAKYEFLYALVYSDIELKELLSHYNLQYENPFGEADHLGPKFTTNDTEEMCDLLRAKSLEALAQ